MKLLVTLGILFVSFAMGGCCSKDECQQLRTRVKHIEDTCCADAPPKGPEVRAGQDKLPGTGFKEVTLTPAFTEACTSAVVVAIGNQYPVSIGKYVYMKPNGCSRDKLTVYGAADSEFSYVAVGK